MNVLGNAITAVAALLGVFLGGWLTIRNQERQWQREHARQWRDIRLKAYNDFTSAYRLYVAFALEPTASITAVPHPRHRDRTMPFFDEIGRPYKEQLESATMAFRLVCQSPDTYQECGRIVNRARQIAAARATHAPGQIPDELFHRLWAAQHAFLNAAREELGLPAMEPVSDPPPGDQTPAR
ncbi:hypothetical protein [Nocardia sp. NPDC004711]